MCYKSGRFHSIADREPNVIEAENEPRNIENRVHDPSAHALPKRAVNATD
jgi:hypothetical protein